MESINKNHIMKNVDVVIVSWAKTEELRQVTIKAIDSLLNDKSVNFHVYIVESNPDVNYDYFNDPSFHWGSGHLRTSTIHPTEPFGYHRYLNIGRRAGTSPYVALCNNDLTFESGWAEEIIRLMETYPRFLSASPWCPQTQGSNSEFRDKIYEGYRVRGELAGWCIFQQRKIYDIIGELDDRFEFWYCDNDYSLELQKYGISHGLVCNSVVNHHENNLGKTGYSLSQEEQRKITIDQYKIFEEKWNKK